MNQQSRVLKAIRILTSIPNLPQRYRIAAAASQRFVANNGLYFGSVGPYSVTFDFSDPLQRLMFFGLYDQPEIALLKKVLKKGDTFFDVGAYVGYYSLIASGIVGEKGQVHSFEPVPRLSDSLIKTVQQNGIRNITVNQVAVCEDEGIVSVYVADQSSLNLGTSSVFGTADQKTTVAVQRVSLDSYCAISSISRVNVMKVDIEGSEIECILGMKSLLNKTPPPDLLIEVNPKILRRRGLSSADLMDLLFQAQYRLFRIQDFPFRLILIQRGTEITTLLNLFCTQRALPTSLHAE